MLEDFLISVNDMMTEAGGAAVLGCFIWGLVSTLLSPCHLASIPMLVSYAAAQEADITPRRGVAYAVLFSIGLFASIAIIGLAGALAGRMLGDVPSWAEACAGAAMVGMAYIIGQFKGCSLRWVDLLDSGLHGLSGALLLGALFGVVSGVCTFGFLAPVLGMIVTQNRPAWGAAMAVSFAVGHALPIAAAGSLAGMVNSARYRAAMPFLTKLAALVIAAIGLYFVVHGLSVYF